MRVEINEKASLKQDSTKLALCAKSISNCTDCTPKQH